VTDIPLGCGIDVGSTTVKIAAIQSATGELVFSRYARHKAFQAETLRSMLEELFSQFPGVSFRFAVCGSGGRPIAEALGVPYIQEVVANAIAVRKFYPTAKVAVELGGQDAKIVYFYHDEAGRMISTDMRMNGSCAGGTGAFIDEVASLLQTPIEAFETLAEKGSMVYEISGRCGVFAKTDIQPLLNQGCRREDIALSTFHAIAKQTIGGLAQGLELRPPVIFEGGPITFNPTLIDVFKERLALKDSDIIRPEQPEMLIAHGVALSLGEMFADYPARKSREELLSALAAYRESITTAQSTPAKMFFSSIEEREAFESRHLPVVHFPHVEDHGPVLHAYLGIDAGSTTTKFVLLNEDEHVIDTFYSNNRGDPLIVIKKSLADLHKRYAERGVSLNIKALGTTGYGELLFAKALGADYHTVETVAHAAAARKYVPDVSFILDIGGQDMKAISISNDIVTNITLNEACSSGCGSFLENFASTLNIPVEDIAESAFNAKNPAELGSRCTVFMNSTIITEQKNGKQADDIMAGLCRSIVENVFTKVVRVSNFAALGDKIVVQGGTFKNAAVLRALEQYTGKIVIRSPYPGEMGAIGIALLTKRHIEESGFTSSRSQRGATGFIGFEALESFSYTQETNNICRFCTNNCNRTLISFYYNGVKGATWVTGNRCERGEIIEDPGEKHVQEKLKKTNEKINAVPDMLKIRESLLFKDYPVTPLEPPKQITIGLPRVLDFWRNMPFWTTLFRSLGFAVCISRPSTSKLYEQGLPFVSSDTVCFPAKLAHGHIRDLVDAKVDRIFMPLLSHLPPENAEPFSSFTCPVLKGYPLVVKYSDDPDRRWNTIFDTPIFHWFKQEDRDFQLCRFMHETFGIPVKTTGAAIAQGDAALASFNAVLVAEGERIIADVEKSGKFAIVFGGRHYQFDELVNHRLSHYFTNLGIPVLTVDSLPGLSSIDLSKTMPDINNSNHAQLLAGAIFAARHPALEYVEIFSFGCGHDALYVDEVIRLMDEISGKTPLVLKLDESDVSGPLRIRVRSFIETVQARHKKDAGQLRIKDLQDPYAVKFTRKQKKKKTILIPNVSKSFCKIITAVLKRSGLKAEPLPMGGRDAMMLGKQYVHNDICFPAQVVIGEALAVLKSGKYDPNEVVIGTAKTLCDCRLTNYMALTRKALDEAGYPNVPIASTDFFDPKNLHPGFKLTPLLYGRIFWCLVMVEILEDLRRKIRPYECEKGETNRVFDESVDAITDAFYRWGMPGSMNAYKKAITAMCAVRYEKTSPKPLVFITGEYLLNFHEGANFYIEDYLERNDMEVELPRMYDVYRNLMLFHTISEIKDFHVHHSLFDTLFAFGGDKFVDFTIDRMEKIAKQHPLYECCLRLPEMAKLSDHIIHHSIQSGEGFLMAGDILHRAAQGVKSFIILQPWGCLPNHICGRGIIKRLKEEYPAIQILPIDYDPDTSFANVENRLQMLIMSAKGF
jgi:predicted CoA-substrate-specific enzyme activase